jgi:hypothetical protein
MSENVFCNNSFTWCNPCHNFLNIQSYVDNKIVLFNMDTSSSINAPGVQIPNYPLSTADLSRPMKHTGSVNRRSWGVLHDGDGSRSCSRHGAVVPLMQPASNEILDITFVAAAKAMFLQLHERPQPMRTCGHIAAYSAGTAVKRRMSGIEEVLQDH